MSELKDCRCGGEAVFSNEWGRSGVRCSACGISYRPVSCDEERGRQESISVWNTRPIEDALQARVEELESLINNPQYDDFDNAVKTESAHQIERWGKEHDLQKGPMDFLAVWVRLHGKYVEAVWSCDWKKAEHHMITAAACLRNHHAAMKAALSNTGEEK